MGIAKQSLFKTAWREQGALAVEKQEEVTAMDIIRQLEAEQAAKIEAKRKLPEFNPGDTVRVNVRVTEG